MLSFLEFMLKFCVGRYFHQNSWLEDDTSQGFELYKCDLPIPDKDVIKAHPNISYILKGSMIALVIKIKACSNVFACYADKISSGIL